MDIVDNVDEAQPVDLNDDDTGTPMTQEDFDNTWKSFYVQNMEALRRLFEQVAEPMKAEFEAENADFDLENNEEHRKAFEEAVIKNVPPSAEPYIMGVINGGLVFAAEMARRYNFDMDDLKKTLDDLNPNSNQTKAKVINQLTEENDNGSKVQ